MSHDALRYTLVLTLVTGQMVTLEAARTRVGARWLAEEGGLESLEWALSSGPNAQAAGRCIVEVDEAGQILRLFPSHAIAVARIDASSLAE